MRLSLNISICMCILIIYSFDSSTSLEKDKFFLEGYIFEIFESDSSILFSLPRSTWGISLLFLIAMVTLEHFNTIFSKQITEPVPVCGRLNNCFMLLAQL